MKLLSDFGVSLKDPVDELTVRIREYIRTEIKMFCIHCKSKRIVKDGLRQRKNIPAVQAYECKDCGGKFVERAFTPFYHKKYPEGLILLSFWFFYERGSIHWTKEKLTEEPCYQTVHRWIMGLTLVLINLWPTFGEGGGVVQSDEMYFKACKKRYYLIGSINKQKKSVVIPMLGNDALHLFLAFRKKIRYTGAIEEIHSDAWKPYKDLARWINAKHDFVNKSKEGFVNDRGITVNDMENFWSLLRPWLNTLRGVKTYKSLDLFLFGYCFYHDFVKYKKNVGKALVMMLVKGHEKTFFILIYSSLVF